MKRIILFRRRRVLLGLALALTSASLSAAPAGATPYAGAGAAFDDGTVSAAAPAPAQDADLASQFAPTQEQIDAWSARVDWGGLMRHRHAASTASPDEPVYVRADDFAPPSVDIVQAAAAGGTDWDAIATGAAVAFAAALSLALVTLAGRRRLRVSQT